MCDNSDVVDKAIATMKDGQTDIKIKRHLGGNTYISMNMGYQCVNIRRFDSITNSERLYPTNDGIGLRILEWARIVERMSIINEVIPCFMEPSYCGQLEFLRCPECQPNTLHEY